MSTTGSTSSYRPPAELNTTAQQDLKQAETATTTAQQQALLLAAKNASGLTTKQFDKAASSFIKNDPTLSSASKSPLLKLLPDADGDEPAGKTKGHHGDTDGADGTSGAAGVTPPPQQY